MHSSKTKGILDDDFVVKLFLKHTVFVSKWYASLPNMLECLYLVNITVQWNNMIRNSEVGLIMKAINCSISKIILGNLVLLAATQDSFNV